MNLSAAFILRPIATTLLAIGIAIAGIVAFNFLPVSSLPQVEFPTILVQASLSGASSEIMASSVTTPIEKSLSRISGITDITSSSQPGKTQIIIQFDLDKGIDGAASDVQAALDAAQANLPSTMTSRPTYKKVNPADSPIMVFALTSESHPQETLYDIASTTIQQKLLKVNGVGQVLLAGSSLPAVRIELNPYRMFQYGISLQLVSQLLSENNVNKAKGQISEEDYSYEIITNDQLVKAKEYQEMIIKNNNGNIVRLKDIARVEDSLQDVHNSGIVNGKDAVLIVAFKSPNSNVVKTNGILEEAFFSLRHSIPKPINMQVVMDRTTTIKASLHEVKKALVAAVIFVLIVVYLFLGNLRSVIIPGVAMVLSLLGTFAIMWLLGYSLNILSLMALTIATGFVVDDAIVVLENITRYIENGLKPKEAALKGSEEIGFTVSSISISLIAVFIPILLMGGIVGRLFREFAITLSLSIMISLLVSLTLSPMMCSLLLKENKVEESKISFFDRLKEYYKLGLQWSLNHQRFMLFLTLVTIILNIILFVKCSKGFFPQQDTGRVVGTILTDQKSSFQSLNRKLKQYLALIKQDPGVENVVGYISAGSVNSATIFIVLKNLEQRKISSDKIIGRIREKVKNLAGANIYMQTAQDLIIGGRQSNAQFQYTISGDTVAEVNQFAPQIMSKIARIPGVADVSSDQGNFALQTFIDIDYDKANRLGINAKTVDTALFSAFGQQSISTIYHDSNQYYVIMEIAPEYNRLLSKVASGKEFEEGSERRPGVYREVHEESSTEPTYKLPAEVEFQKKSSQDPQALSQLYMSTSDQKLVPLSSFSSIHNAPTLLTINHQSLSPSATLSFNLLPGTPLGDAVNSVNESLKDLSLPITVSGAFRGTAQAFQASLKNQPLLILAAIISVYIILGMLYENLLHPVTILSTLPSAGVGAVLALIITETDLSIIAIIGIILLIGIVKKNAIMMIDFVLEIERKEKITPKEAIYQAAILRFRPIMMTTMAALLGAVPMAIGNGLGTELQKPLGITIIGGLIFSQMLTLFTIPVIYLFVEKLRKKLI